MQFNKIIFVYGNIFSIFYVFLSRTGVINAAFLIFGTVFTM